MGAKMERSAKTLGHTLEALKDRMANKCKAGNKMKMRPAGYKKTIRANGADKIALIIKSLFDFRCIPMVATTVDNTNEIQNVTDAR